MSTISTQFEIEPYRLELEYEFEQERGGRGGGGRGGGSRGNFRGPKPRPLPKPWPNFRQRRDRYRHGGGGGYDLEPAVVLEPASAAPSEHVRWMQSMLNRAIGAALSVDGVMSDSVRDAIREFQRRNRLPTSGFVGPDTEAALRRVRGGPESRELEFEWEAELTGDALAADSALSQSKATPIAFALKSLGKQVLPGLYRFFTTDGRFYTGKATDLRRRIVQHLWCLSHFGVPTKGHRLVLYRMPGKTADQVRAVEFAINKHHQNNKLRLNKVSELEFLELINL